LPSEKALPEVLPVQTIVTAEAIPVNQRPGTSATEQTSDTTVFFVVDEEPQFPGDDNARLRFLAQNISYPEKAQNEGKQGRVTVQFIVEKDGSLTNVKIVEGVSPELDAEAVRVIRSMPKWIPGKQRGVNVRVSYMLPIQFRLQR
jgi:protein TonB